MKLTRHHAAAAAAGVFILSGITLVASHQVGGHKPKASTNYYVTTTGSDAANGLTPATAWLTIKHAAATVDASSVVHVAAGSYSENVVVINRIGPISFISDTPLGAVVTASGTNYHTFFLTGQASYITIQGFEITVNSPNSASAGIDIDTGTGGYDTFDHNYVHDIATGLTGCIGGSAINGQPASHVTVTGNKIAHIGPSSGLAGCSGHGNMHGAYLSGDHNVFYNNLIWDISGWCLQIWPWGANDVMENNDGENCRSGGIIEGNDGTTGPLNTGNYIANNIMRNDGAVYTAGGYCAQETGTAGSNDQYVNNDCFGDNFSNTMNLGWGTESGTLKVDPLWVTEIAAGGGDYHLQAGSTMINAGSATNAPSIDFDGVTRTGLPDVGAYER